MYIYTIDSRYIVVQYNTILHSAQLQSKNVGHTSNSRRSNGRAMAAFRELCGEKWPRDIGSALYQLISISK